ncbi:MAG: hypothetical protein ACLU9S_07360 [Oscillospiraceae bacterium]
MSNCFPAGIDIGSTTVKLVILDANGQICFGQYRRHRAHTQETLAELLREARAQGWDLMRALGWGSTGSGSMNLGKALGIGFVQEVVAVAASLERVAPQTDVAIELGGEDAKIIYFRRGLSKPDERRLCRRHRFVHRPDGFLAPDRRPWSESGGGKTIGRFIPLPPGAVCLPSPTFSPHQRRQATLPDLAGPIFQAVVNRDHLRVLACRQAHPRLCGRLGRAVDFLPELKRAFYPHAGFFTPEKRGKWT